MSNGTFEELLKASKIDELITAVEFVLPIEDIPSELLVRLLAWAKAGGVDCLRRTEQTFGDIGYLTDDIRRSLAILDGTTKGET